LSPENRAGGVLMWALLWCPTARSPSTRASIGSNNFTNRSLALNSELSFSLSDQRIVAELEQHFRDDLELSDEFDLETWRARPLRKRLIERAISPIRDMF
jgi:cardiolipin synthase